MRKIIFCGAAFVACGAVSVVFAALYAAENPDSFLGRCAILASEVVSRCNPLLPFSDLRQRPTAIVQTKPIPDPVQVVPGSRDAVYESMRDMPRAAGPIVIDSPQLPEAVTAQTIEPDTLRGDEESNGDLPMPFTQPEQVPNPPFVPYADDDDDCEAETTDDPENEDATDVDQEGAFQEDPAYHHQYPSCPYTGHCPVPYYSNPPVIESPAPVEKKDTTTPTPPPGDKPVKPAVSMQNRPASGTVPAVDTMECRPTDLSGDYEESGPY